MANIIYDSFKVNIGNGTIDWDDNNSIFKVLLVTDQYAVDSTSQFVSQIADEVVGQGYTVGGEVITGRSISLINGAGIYNASDVTWTYTTLNVKGAVIYKDSGDLTTSPLIAFIEFNGNKSTENGDFTLQWSTNGVFKVE